MSLLRRVADVALGSALRFLPPGPIRRRYRDELVAELHDMTDRRRTVAALGILLRAWTLRVAVTGRPSRRPVGCWTHLHHRWALEHTDDGGLYTRCRGCGKDDVVCGPYVGSVWVMWGPNNP